MPLKKRLLAAAAAVTATAGFTLAGAMLSFPVHAKAQSRVAIMGTPDDLFLALRDASRNSDLDTVNTIAPRLADYAIPSYVDYYKLKPRLRDLQASQAEIRDYLSRYDGTAIAESMAICRYFEALHPDPPLFGRGPLDSALVEMWNLRAEFHLLAPVATVFQHLHPYMKRMVDPQVPAWGEANKPRIFEFLQFLDSELSGRPYIAG